MKVEFTKRAVNDLRDIADHSHRQFGPRVAAALEQRIRDITIQIGNAPDSAPLVEQRPGMRVLPLLRYPFNIRYSIALLEIQSASFISGTQPGVRGGRINLMSH